MLFVSLLLASVVFSRPPRHMRPCHAAHHPTANLTTMPSLSSLAPLTSCAVLLFLFFNVCRLYVLQAPPSLSATSFRQLTFHACATSLFPLNFTPGTQAVPL